MKNESFLSSGKEFHNRGQMYRSWEVASSAVIPTHLRETILCIGCIVISASHNLAYSKYKRLLHQTRRIVGDINFKVFQQSIDILKALIVLHYWQTYIHLRQNLFRFCCSIKTKKLALSFNHTCRYINDLLSISNHNFHTYVHLIYLEKLEIKVTTESDKSATYLNILDRQIDLFISKRCIISLMHSSILGRIWFNFITQ
jgi:hypothetical protein